MGKAHVGKIKGERHMASSTYKIITVFGALVASGCQMQAPMHSYQPMQMDMSYMQQGQNNMQQSFNQGQMQAPSMGGNMAQAQPVLVTTQEDQRVSALTAELTSLQDRLARTERAMLRLDRRMQLVEANELTRMDGAQMSALDQTDIQPVALVGNTDISPVQARPIQTFPQNNIAANTSANARMVAVSARTQEFSTQGQGRALLGLPSLADTKPKGSTETPAELSTWLVRYQEKKIWPERAQLKSSRDVVTALRQQDKPVAVYARGKNTSSKEFRERVRAISRYLSKVSEREQVPIAALPADHLDGDTIEIFTAQ